MRQVDVVIEPGSIGQAIAQRVSSGKRVLLAYLREESASAAVETLSEAGFDMSMTTVDISSRASIRAQVELATSMGEVTKLIHAASVSPS